MKQLLLEAFLPVVSAALSIFVPALLALAFARFQKWTGMEIEARHREALQGALMSAAKLVVSGATKARAVDYVLSAVPDALKAFNASDRARIEQLIEPRLAELAIVPVLSEVSRSSNLIRDQPK